MPRPESALLRTLYAPLLADAQREVELALRVAYGLEAGLRPEQIAARLDVTLGEVKAATVQVKRVRARLDQG